VSEIAAVVDDARSGGLAVELRMRGDDWAIAPAVGAALYRIAQEALANAARHAPRARTVLALELRDRRACLVAQTTGPTVAAPAGEAERGGYGLIGMRERAAALGGELTAGPTAEGWLVRCTIPLDAEDRVAAANGSRRSSGQGWPGSSRRRTGLRSWPSASAAARRSSGCQPCGRTSS
jgi:signal transduction histidine kinase